VRLRRTGTAAAVGVDWTAVADGRVWRLRRGRHFEGGDRAVVAAARAAARDMDMVVSVAREDYGPTAGYVWVQFADAEVAHGAPCPRCGSTTLVRNHPGFATCPRCAARLVLLVEDDAVEQADDDDLLDGAADEPAPAPVLEAPPVDEPTPSPPDAAPPVAAPPVAAPPPAAPAPVTRVERQLPQVRYDTRTPGIDRLEFYEQVRLKAGAHPPSQPAFYGFGQGRGVKPTFLYVEFFPADGSPGRGDHRVTSVAARPFAAAVDFRALNDWPRFEMRLLGESDLGELIPVHPYYSLDPDTGRCVIPVLTDVQTIAPGPSRAARTSP